MKIIKKYYEYLLLAAVILIFFLYRREIINNDVYAILSGAIALYFVPIKLIKSVTNINTKQTGLQVVSSIIIASFIGITLILVYDKHFYGLKYIVYGLAVINFVFMIYSFFKDLERRTFALHFIIAIFASIIIDFI